MYLSTSKTALLILAAWAVSLVVVATTTVFALFFQGLTDREITAVTENLPRAMIETCLAMTTFVEDFNGLSIALFGGLLVTKTLHWVVQCRVDFLDTQPDVSRGQHARLACFLGGLAFLDAQALRFSLGRAVARPRSVLLLFAFEHAILGVQVGKDEP